MRMGDIDWGSFVFTQAPDSAPDVPISPDVSTAASGGGFLDTLSSFVKDVALPVYSAYSQSEAQKEQMQFQLKMAELQQKSPFGLPLFGRSLPYSGQYRTVYNPQYGSVYASEGFDFMPWLLAGGAVALAYFLTRK